MGLRLCQACRTPAWCTELEMYCLYSPNVSTQQMAYKHAKAAVLGGTCLCPMGDELRANSRILSLSNIL